MNDGVILEFSSKLKKLDAEDASGTYYSTEWATKLLESENFKECISNGMFCGVNSTSFITEGWDGCVPMGEVSFVPDKVYIKDGYLWGDFWVLDAPMGRQLKRIIENKRDKADDCIAVFGKGSIVFRNDLPEVAPNDYTVNFFHYIER